MKTLILYYSRNGNNRKLAEQLKGKLKDRTEIAEIKEVADMSSEGKIIPLLMKTTFGIKTTTRNIPKKFENYDNILLCFPIWMGKIPSPVRDAIARNLSGYEGKIYFGMLSGKVDNPKAIAKLMKIFGSKIDRSNILQLPVSEKPINQDHAPNIRFDEKDFENDFYRKKIDAFLKQIK